MTGPRDHHLVRGHQHLPPTRSRAWLDDPSAFIDDIQRNPSEQLLHGAPGLQPGAPAFRATTGVIPAAVHRDSNNPACPVDHQETGHHPGPPHLPPPPPPLRSAAGRLVGLHHRAGNNRVGVPPGFRVHTRQRYHATVVEEQGGLRRMFTVRSQTPSARLRQASRDYRAWARRNFPGFREVRYAESQIYVGRRGRWCSSTRRSGTAGGFMSATSTSRAGPGATTSSSSPRPAIRLAARPRRSPDATGRRPQHRSRKRCDKALTLPQGQGSSMCA
jgi:hypothetical protein